MSSARKQIAPGVNPVDVRKLSLRLADGHFHKGKTLGMNDRVVRQICASYPGEFLATHEGFKLVRYASDAEIETAIAELRSRVKALNERADGLERAYKARADIGQRTLFGEGDST